MTWILLFEFCLFGLDLSGNEALSELELKPYIFASGISNSESRQIVLYLLNTREYLSQLTVIIWENVVYFTTTT